MTEVSATPDTTQPQPSRNRVIVATTTTVAVTVILGIVANYGIGWVGAKVHNKIIPPTPEPTPTDV